MSTSPVEGQSFLRIRQVLSRIPVSRSTWYAGIKSGLYPAPVKLGARVAAWRCCDINKLAESFIDEALP